MGGRPNILFFLADDQRFDTIGALGNRQILTPNLDRLVARGTVFTHAHIAGGTCPAVCMPSRAMLHSGRTLFRLAGEGQEIPAAHAILGESLRQTGYVTFGTGKWHNGRASYARSFSCGAEIFFGGMGDHWNVPAYDFDLSGRYAATCPFVPQPETSNALAYRACNHITAGKHSTDLFVDAARQFLRERDGARPFFMYVSLMAPHDPRTMPEKYLRLYDPARIELPGNFMPEHPLDTGALRVRDELLAPLPRTPHDIRRHIAEYYAMISHLDDGLGRLAAALREAGELDNTIIVFSGDNGLALGQHGLMGKQNLYDHSVRVPLIFSGPGIPQGARSRALVYLSDIFPTLCELAGLDTPESVEGKSLASCFTDPKCRLRDTLYLAYGNSIRGVRNERYKLIEYACGASQLFDLAQDPLETQNLAAGAAVNETVSAMRRTLCRLADEWGDAQHSTGHEFWNRRAELRSHQASSV